MNINQESQPEPDNVRRNTARNRLFLSVAVVGLLIVGGLIVLGRFNSEPAAAPLNAEVATATADPAPLAAAPALGPETAPVTITEYGDFGCPACWAWHKMGVLKQLQAKYGDQIRFVWRDFPVITLLSPDAAEAGQCAHEQGKFWEFHDLVYEREGAITASDLQAYAAEIKLDMAQFKECVTSHRYLDRVNAQQHESFQHGFKGAPAFLVNGQKVAGAQLMSTFEDIIDPILASEP
jgi:protein-disulfide isomerase